MEKSLSKNMLNLSGRHHFPMMARLFALSFFVLTFTGTVSAQETNEAAEFEKNALELSFDFVDSEVKTVFGLNFGFEF
jgi:hypothetical protein